MTEFVQYMGPKFVSHGIPTIDTLDENSIILIPDTRIISTPNITHRSVSEHAVGKVTAIGDAVGYYREENYKAGFEIWNENSKLQSKPKNIEMS